MTSLPASMSHKVSSTLRSGGMDGQAGSILASGNPAAERRLAATLSKIDREKKKRESAMTWNQRSFFIRQVFDQDNDLRFVKAARRPKYLENIPPAPRDGDTSWQKDDYVFSFKPKTLTSPNSRVYLGRRRSKENLDEASKAPEVDMAAAVTEAQAAEEAKTLDEEEKAKEAAEEQARRAEEERLEKEKKDRGLGMFGTRREKLKMPVLMMGGVRSSQENEKTLEKEQDVIESESAEPEQIIEQIESLDAKGTEEGPTFGGGEPGETVKPKVRFPVLKVRALGLFAMTFKKNDSLPQLPSPRQLQAQATQEGQSTTGTSPPQTTPVDNQPPRPGSISLPNSPIVERRPLLRQNSANAAPCDRALAEQPNSSSLMRSPNETLRKSRRGSRRDLASQASERQRRSSSSEKGNVSAVSAALPRVKRKESTDLTNPGNATLGGQESMNIWAKMTETSDARKHGEENKDGSIQVDDIEGETQNDDIDIQVIRRIIRTLPTNLMMKTTKREAEAGGEYALMRQRLMDRAKADMMRKAALDPRFTKLQKSLSNTVQK